MVRLLQFEKLSNEVAYLQSKIHGWWCNLAAYAVLERNMKSARSQAKLAWYQKDYESVVKLLGPFRSSLTPAEVKKLEYAERQLD